MAKFEKEELAQEINKIKEEIKVLMLPKDSDDKRDIIMEIRAGTGGDEAALFVGDLFRMYKKFFENENIKVELMSLSETETGGFKEIIFLAKGQSVYGKVKFETGVHRVQRIPDTETNGRIHTSACTVAVLPEAKESEVTIEDSDLKIDTYRAGGAGGQHVNTTDSAVRITHLPTNTVVTCQDERSQQKNKTKAMKVLASRILANIKQQERMQRDGERKNQVGTGDRSERIRTYNYPQGRITDHRINKTIHQFDSFMNGEMQEIIQALKIDEKSRLLLDNG